MLLMAARVGGLSPAWERKLVPGTPPCREEGEAGRCPSRGPRPCVHGAGTGRALRSSVPAALHWDTLPKHCHLSCPQAPCLLPGHQRSEDVLPTQEAVPHTTPMGAGIGRALWGRPHRWQRWDDQHGGPQAKPAALLPREPDAPAPLCAGHPGLGSIGIAPWFLKSTGMGQPWGGRARVCGEGSGAPVLPPFLVPRPTGAPACL